MQLVRGRARRCPGAGGLRLLTQECFFSILLLSELFFPCLCVTAVCSGTDCCVFIVFLEQSLSLLLCVKTHHVLSTFYEAHGSYVNLFLLGSRVHRPINIKWLHFMFSCQLLFSIFQSRISAKLVIKCLLWFWFYFLKSAAMFKFAVT